MLKGKKDEFVKSCNIPSSPHERAFTKFNLFQYPTVYGVSSKKLSFLTFLNLKIE